MFSLPTSRAHSAQKRLVSNLYSKSYLQSSGLAASVTQEIIYGRLLPLLASYAKVSTPFDVLSLNHGIAMDFVSSYIFGLKNSTNFIRDVKAREHWLETFFTPRPYIFWPGELPVLMWLMGKVGWHVFPKRSYTAVEKIEDWCAQMCISAATEYSPKLSTSDKASNSQTVFTVLTRALTPPSDRPFAMNEADGLSRTDKLIASELLDHLGAGQETSGLTLTYLIHEMSQRPDLQDRLRTELLTLSPPIALSSSVKSEPQSLPPFRTIDALPILHAIIMETLRLRAPISGPQPRKTPAHPPASLAGSPPLPPNVRVSAQAYSLHRNPSVFPNPETWYPERWLLNEAVGREADANPHDGEAGSTKEKIDEMQRWFWAFGSGGRMCVGSNFAMMNLKVVVAGLYTRWRTIIVDDEGIEQVQGYVSPPKGGKLMIRLEDAAEEKLTG